MKASNTFMQEVFNQMNEDRITVQELRDSLINSVKHQTTEPRYSVTKQVYQDVKQANRVVERMKLKFVEYFDIKIEMYDSWFSVT